MSRMVSVSVNKEARKLYDAVEEHYGKVECAKIFRIGLRSVCREANISVEAEENKSKEVIPEL